MICRAFFIAVLVDSRLLSLRYLHVVALVDRLAIFPRSRSLHRGCRHRHSQRIRNSGARRAGRRAGCRQRTHNPPPKGHRGFDSHPAHHSKSFREVQSARFGASLLVPWRRVLLRFSAFPRRAVSFREDGQPYPPISATAALAIETSIDLIQAPNGR